MCHTPGSKKTNRRQCGSDISAFYREKARETVLLQLVTGSDEVVRKLPSAELENMQLNSEIYQVVISESFNLREEKTNSSFPELLYTAGGGSSFFECLQMGRRNVVLLKGRQGLHIFRDFLRHYDNIQPGSSLDSLFLAYGSPVDSPYSIHVSYEEAHSLVCQRFFCPQDQHTLGYIELANGSSYPERYTLDCELTEKYCSLLVNCLQTSDFRQIDSILLSLKTALRHVDAPVHSIKLFLASLLLQVKESTMNMTPPLQYPSNSSILYDIDSCHCLDEILLYLYEQLKTAGIGNSDKASVFSGILDYIDRNYQRSLRLEDLASLFGYNSAYLGRLFTKMTGSSFNTYLDRIRIEHSEKLLLENRLRIHEIAVQVGYKNADYFQQKFKKCVGMSPSEYRRQHRLTK